MESLQKKERGAALLEFALISIILFSIIFGIISYGIMLYNQAVITNAARTGVRAGIVYATSGNGLTGYTTYPSTCTTLTTPAIYSASATTIKTGSESTANCSANNALVSTRLINFGSTPVVPSITAASCTSPACTATCATITPSCILEVTITYNYTGVFHINSNLSAKTSMYYE